MNMKKFLYLLFAMFITVGLNACSPDDDPENEPPTEIPENPDDPHVTFPVINTGR